MLEHGLHFDSAMIDEMKISACHWVTKTNKPYIIIRFETMKCKKLLDRKKKDMDRNYMPHGQRLFVRDDLTRDQSIVAKEVRDIAMILRSKGYYVYANLEKLRIGQPPSQIWLHYQDPRVQTMIGQPSANNQCQPQSNTMAK